MPSDSLHHVLLLPEILNVHFPVPDLFCLEVAVPQPGGLGFLSLVFPASSCVDLQLVQYPPQHCVAPPCALCAASRDEGPTLPSVQHPAVHG